MKLFCLLMANFIVFLSLGAYAIERCDQECKSNWIPGPGQTAAHESTLTEGFIDVRNVEERCYNAAATAVSNGTHVLFYQWVLDSCQVGGSRCHFRCRAQVQ